MQKNFFLYVHYIYRLRGRGQQRTAAPLVATAANTLVEKERS
jgi:hypothetical protein